MISQPLLLGKAKVMINNQPRGNTIVMANGVGCPHCHQAITLNMPMPLDMAVKILKAFADLHQFCHQQQVFVADVNEPTAKARGLYP